MPLPVCKFKSELDQVEYSLKKTLHELDEINSNFEATKAFLNARGLSRVSELDRNGREELIAYLENLYERMKN